MNIAQFNISQPKFNLDEPIIAPFIESLSQVNELADNSKGFVWRMQDSSGNALAIPVWEGTNIIFNLSVWNSITELKQFVYRSKHSDILKQRGKWFEIIKEASYVLWYVADGYLPTLEEAKAQLEYLRKYDATEQAFTFNHIFEPT